MKIVENQKEYLDDFIRLNEEWISTFFELEDVDLALAANPYKVIEDGGYIFSLVSGDDVLGVCALFNCNDGVYELARMAVAPRAHGKGYADKLMLAALAKLNDLGAKKVLLISNTQLNAAISLYKKHGFNTVSLGPHPVYSRADIVMERHLT